MIPVTWFGPEDRNVVTVAMIIYQVTKYEGDEAINIYKMGDDPYHFKTYYKTVQNL